jgi:cobaltochelatase CobS
MAKPKPLMQPRADLSEAEKLLIPDINPAYFFGELGEEVQFDIAEGRKVLLTGHMGCGKTSLFEQFAANFSQPLMRANMDGQVTTADLVGFWTVKGGETVWVDGILTLCMRRGFWCVLDEIDKAEAAILAVITSVAEKNGKLFLKEKGHEIVTPHKDFRLLATANTVGIMEEYRHIYQGSNIMNRALLDRFRVYHVDYLPEDKEAKVLAATVPNLPLDAAEILVQLANLIRDAFNTEVISSTFSLRQLIDFAELMTRKKEKDTAGKLQPNDIIMQSAKTIYSKVSKEDGEFIKGMIQRSLMKKAG